MTGFDNGVRIYLNCGVGRNSSVLKNCASKACGSLVIVPWRSSIDPGFDPQQRPFDRGNTEL